MLNSVWIFCLIVGTVADLRTPKNSGIIVNPFYDPKDDANDIKKTDPNEILPPTHQQLAETMNLRNIINDAVRRNIYFVEGSDPSSMVPPSRPKLFSWFANLLASGKSVASSNIEDDDKVGSEIAIKGSDTITVPPAAAGSNEGGGIKSNWIDSAIMSRLESKPFTLAPKKVQREQLELISIEEDLSFPYGEHIRSWIAIEANHHKNGLIGISDTSLVLIADRSGTYEIVKELDLKTQICHFTTYQHWNQTSQASHAVVIVEIANQLLFISTGNDLSDLIIVWQWTIHSALDTLVYFKLESSDMILMVNSPLGDSISADIYKFDLESRQTWLVQKISLNNPCKSVAIINTHRELILCFAQNNTVQLYKCDQHADTTSFKFFSSIEANSVQTVTGFEMGGYSYLGTTGLEPKIFRYHRGNFVAQTILTHRWGMVEFLFPIPARTYRDDLILLVQHRIMMGTHSVSVVEALIWDGESFDVSLSVPCRMGEEIMDFGMTCLLDYDRDSGIDGLSVIQSGNSIAIIVPRIEAPSSMFRLTFQLTTFDSPVTTVVQNFENLSKHIEATTNYQNEIMSTATDALSRGLNVNQNDVTAAWNLSTVTAGRVIVNDGAEWKIDELWYGNDVWSEENVNIDDLWKTLQQLRNDVDVLEKEFSEKNSNSPIHRIVVPSVNGNFDMKTARILNEEHRSKRSESTDKHMHFDELNVKHVNVDFINDIPIDDMVFIENGVVNFGESLTVENLNVLNEVEVTSHHVETVGDGIEDRHFSEKIGENIHVTGDLIIDSINGIVWQDFVQQIIMRNLPNLITKLIIVGDVVAKDNVAVSFLNQIAFPKDYLWMHESDISVINGQKVFKGTLTADSVDTSGTVDGIFTQDVISLGEIQHIAGLTTFTQLEVTETLNVNGTINGKHLSDFKPNLSLLESNKISSDCLFQNLQVDGPIFIANDCNGVRLDDILSDVVYKSHPKSTISSFKTFESIESIVELTSNLVNNIPVENYLTTDTEQNITFDRLVGNVMIQKLYTNGLFNFINATELDRNSIKLSGEQFTEAELIFDTNDQIDVNVIEIQRTFNELSSNDLIRIDESLEINGNVIVNSAMVSDLVIDGEVNGNGIINGISLNEFDKIRLSRTLNQDITSMYHIENVVINNDIDATYVNGIDISDLRKHMNHITNIPDYLSSNDVKVSNLMIDGNLLVQTINGHDFNSIRDNVVWLNQPNIVNAELQFLDAVEVRQGVIVNNLNGEIFEDFVNGIVLKSDENVEFTGRKVFQNELHVDQDIQIGTLNGISMENIWTKNLPIQLTGTVNVVGDLFVENVNLQGYVNSVHWREIDDNYQFDDVRSAHVLKSNVRFSNPTNIDHLRIQHGLNSVENITEFLSNVIRMNHAGVINGKKQFLGNVVFRNNIQVANMDAVDIPSQFENMVINDANQKIVITGDIAFDNDVTATEIRVSGSVLTNTVMDCSLAEWKENALITNAPVKIFQQIVFPAGTLQTGNVELQFLNGNSLSSIFTLNSDQFFGHSLLSDLVSVSRIDVDGLVNGYNVKGLMDNSVLVTGENYITAPTTIQSGRVLNILQTVGTVNGKNVNNIATLHEDLHLYGPLSFRSIKARSINTKDTISGIDFDHWYANALWKSRRENQIVSGVWTVTEGVFHSSIKGSGTLNGVAIENLAGQIHGHQTSVLHNFEMFSQGYVENCHRMQNLIQKTKTFPFFVTHFDESFSLRFPNVLNSVHFFESNRQNYAIVNSGCLTIVYVWSRYGENFEKISEIETGNVDSWLDMTDDTNLLHLISNTETDRSNCPTSGLNVWKFDGKNLVHVSKVADSNKFTMVHSSKIHPQRFLAMTKDDGIVRAFDLENNLLEQWHLPMSNEQFRFVPESANLGIALSNGKQLSSLSYAKERKKRSTSLFDDSTTERKRYRRCPYLDEKVENATNKCILWHKANLLAMSNIGPYKNVDPDTQNRLLEDVSKSNVQPRKRPFKLKAIPWNGLPVQNSPKNEQLLTSTGTQLNSGSEPFNPTSRDAFGDIEAAAIQIADNVIDSLIDKETENDDVDFDDSFVGGPIDTSKIKSNHSTTDTNPSNNHTAESRDMFGDVEAKTIKFVDKVVDAFLNVKDSAKESQAKLHNMFPVLHPENNGHYRTDENSVDRKFENLPKIPTIVYAKNDTNLHNTQSSPTHESTSNSTTEDFTTTTTEHPTTSDLDVGEEEPKISKEISSEGIATAENLNFPHHPAEEIVAITVGGNKKHLVAVSSLRDHTIQGKHDLIRIYEDIIEGNLFQTLLCHRPRSLSVMNLRDETILAFIENDADIQIFVYRGIQGFVKFTNFEMPSFVQKLTSIHLPVGMPFECKRSFLAATMKKEIRFVEVKTCGYCGVNAPLRCELSEF